MSSDYVKSKAIRNLEQKMASIEPGSLRYQVLEASKKFKSSWIELGRILYGVYKDKHFKTWGYLSFEAYCQTEVGIQKQTAGKLIHSYYFLEKDEPELLKGIHADGSASPKNIPSLEAVNVLRLAAKNKELTEDDYQDFKKSVFEEGKDGKEVKKQVGLRLRSLREEEDPQKARALRRTTTLRRLYATLRTLEKEVNSAHLVSDRISKELEKLLGYLESEIGEE